MTHKSKEIGEAGVVTEGYEGKRPEARTSSNADKLISHGKKDRKWKLTMEIDRSETTEGYFTINFVFTGQIEKHPINTKLNFPNNVQTS